MADFPSVPLGDLVMSQDGRRRPIRASEREAGPFPYYGASGVIDSVADYIFDGLHLLIAEDGENLRTRKTPVAFLADGKFWVNNHAHVVVANGKADTRYLCYAVESSDISGFLTGSTQPKLTQAALLKLPVIAPPLAEQCAIADVLGALDDKIESNRRLVRTAREFIDALFCTAFSDGEINVQLSSLAEVVDCLHTKKPDQAPGGKQLLQLSNISDDGFLILGNHYPISLNDYTKWIANIEANEGDVILTNVGRVGALARLPKGVKAALGRNMTAIRAHKPGDALFIFAALNNAQVRRGMKSLIDVGTIMDALNVHAIRRILLPESTVLQRDNFASAIGAVVDRAEVAVKESSGLESLREALLPELLSGRLRVRDTESMMENV